MQKLPKDKARNIGVSNFGIKNLKHLLSHHSCKTVPAVNQIELHPNNPSPKLVDFCKEKNIHCTGYSCLGSTDSPLYRNELLKDMASKKQKMVQQILLVWGIQKGWSVIPKSVTQERIEKNFEIDGWTLDENEMHVVRIASAFSSIKLHAGSRDQPCCVFGTSLGLLPNPRHPSYRALPISSKRNC